MVVNTPDSDNVVVVKNSAGEYKLEDFSACKKPPKPDEKPKCWPQVGDEVLATNDYKLEARGLDGVNVWCLDSEGDYLTFNISELKKPPTPEEELKIKLKDNLVDTTIRFMSDDKNELPENAYFLVDVLMNKYDIKKKPE